MTEASSAVNLARYAGLSILAAILTIGLKTGAWWLTGSVGLLSDAMESVVNLIAAIMALAMLMLAAQPPDDDHHFGHGKAEYFSSGLEGALILLAAFGIGITAVDRMRNPTPLQQLDLGLAAATVAALINLATARILLRAGRRFRSITLEADAHHLMTDVWTSVGVLVGIGLTSWSGWLILDPLIALAVAVNILWTGADLLRRSFSGLLDATLPPSVNAEIDTVIARYRSQGIGFHDLRTRQAGTQRFMTVHVLVPGTMTIKDGHDLVDAIESEIRDKVPGIEIVTHLEPDGDPASFRHRGSTEAPGVGRLTLTRLRPMRRKTDQPPPPRDRTAGLRRLRQFGGLLLLGGTALSVAPVVPLATNAGLVAALIGFVLIVLPAPKPGR